MAEQAQPKFEIKKIYVKDLSFESPLTPQVFMENPQQPQIEVGVNTSFTKLDDSDIYEVVLKVTCAAKSEDKTYFLIELDQAGLFEIANFDEEQTNLFAEVAAPTNLLPFAREVVCDAITKGGFPSIMINPINFEGSLS